MILRQLLYCLVPALVVVRAQQTTTIQDATSVVTSVAATTVTPSDTDNVVVTKHITSTITPSSTPLSTSSTPSSTSTPTATATPSSAPKKSPLSKTAIIAIAAGGGSFLVLALVASIIACVCIRRRRRRQTGRYIGGGGLGGSGTRRHTLPPSTRQLHAVSRGDLGVHITGTSFFDPSNSSSREQTPTVPVLDEGDIPNGYRGVTKPGAARTARTSLYEKPGYARTGSFDSLRPLNGAFDKEIGVAMSPPVSAPSTASGQSSLRMMTTVDGEQPMSGVVPGAARTRSVVFDKPHYARVNSADMIPRAKSIVYKGPPANRAGTMPPMPRTNTYEKRQYVSATAKTKEVGVPTVVVSPIDGEQHDGSRDAGQGRIGAVSPEMHLWTPDENGMKKIG